MIGIVSTGLSNLSSLQNAINALNFKSYLVEDSSKIAKASSILLPGVGSFNEAMKRLRQRELDLAIIEAAKSGTPILGICLGMQLLADKGYEGGEVAGLGLIPGEVNRIVGDNIKLPHMGWNSLNIIKNNTVVYDGFDGIDYYFIHSYEFNALNPSDVIATVSHGNDIAAIVNRERIYGFQFHPEKSQRAGLGLLESFLLNA
jgi:imidazole glycerol-phosphate synthase subunit HisH